MANRKQRNKRLRRRQASAKNSAQQRARFLRMSMALAAEIDKQARRLEASPSPPKKHHWVPQTYLRQWAISSGDKRIRATDLLVPSRSFLNVPSRLTCSDNLYRVELDEIDELDLPPLSIETLLGVIEGKASPILRRLASFEVERLTVAELEWFALYLSFQNVRSPSALRHAQDLESKVATQMLIAETRDAEARWFFASGRFRVAKVSGVYVAQMGRLAYEVMPYFLNRTWVLFDTPPMVLTCDEPVALVPAPGASRGVRPGLQHAGAIVFPAGPQAILVLFRNDLAPAQFEAGAPRIQRGSLSDAETQELVLETAMAADRWVFESPETLVGESLSLPHTPATEWPFQGEIDHGAPIRLHLPPPPTRWSDPAWVDRPLPVSWWWSEGA